jgi:hypothetical protein
MTTTDITTTEWVNLLQAWGLRPSSLTHYWGALPPEFEENKDLPFTVNGEAVSWTASKKFRDGGPFDAVEFRYWPD